MKAANEQWSGYAEGLGADKASLEVEQLKASLASVQGNAEVGTVPERCGGQF